MIIMSFGMSVIIGAVVTAVHTGFNDGFFNRYTDSLIYAFPIAIVCV